MTASPRRWKLWHLSVAVLGSALIFATFRAAAVEGNLSLAVAAAFTVGAAISLFSLATRMGSRSTLGLRAWGLRQGGVVGFAAWAVGIMISVAIDLGTITFGAIASVLLLRWLLAGLF